jgi:hypothetical protein
MRSVLARSTLIWLVIAGHAFAREPAKRRHELPTAREATKLARAKLARARAGATPDTAAVPSLTYYGGPILRSPEIWVVFWGPVVDEDATLNHYDHILQAPMFDMLAEYDTQSPAQTIGHGTFGGVVYDTDAPTPSSLFLDDTAIQMELARLIDKGRLPDNAPGNRLFQIYFPPGVAIGSGSCLQFCAYHTSFTLGTQEIYYSVLPDYSEPNVIGGDCSGMGCGAEPTGLENLMSAAAHELTEAITDPDVGSAVADGPPLAWSDPVNGEIGDICYFIEDGTNGNFVVQNEWSNQLNACVDHVPADTISLEVSPAQALDVVPGSSATFTVTIESTAGSPISAKLDVPSPFIFLPPGVTVSFDPTTITGSGTSTMTVEVDSTVSTGDYPFPVAATGTPGYIPYVMPELFVQAAPPAVSDLSPTSGPSNGDGNPFFQVTLFGSDLVPQSVSFGDTDGTLAGTDLLGDVLVIAPGHAPGMVDVVVTDVDGATVPAGSYTFEDSDPPRVVKVEPSAGPAAGGTYAAVTIVNAGPDATFDFGGVPADTTNTFFAGNDLDGATIMLVPVPAHAAGKVDLTVTSGDGQTGTASFTYGSSPAPEAVAITVGSGSTLGGTFAQLTGRFFQPGAHITVGGAAAAVRTISPSFIDGTGFAGFVTPPGIAPGIVDVVITNPDGQSATLKRGFIYLAPAPAASGLSPAYGSTAGGQMVTITGTSFVDTPEVLVDGKAVTVATSTATSITFSSPQHGTGPVLVVVQNPDGQRSAPAVFTYLAPAPSVTTLSATSGPKAGGQALTLTGVGFVAPVAVSFGGVTATVTTATATSLSITTPAHASGVAALVVTNPDGQTSVPLLFTFLDAAPAVTGLSAATGASDGRQQVTINGSGFEPGAAVAFGGNSAWVLNVSATAIVVLTPPHAEGTVAVVVTNPDGQSASLAGAFTFAKVVAGDAGTAGAGGSGSSGGCNVGGGGSGGALWLLGFLALAGHASPRKRSLASKRRRPAA